jgi:hypothetical protein
MIVADAALKWNLGSTCFLAQNYRNLSVRRCGSPILGPLERRSFRSRTSRELAQLKPADLSLLPAQNLSAA